MTDSPVTVATGAAITLLAGVALEIAEVGYSRAHEREADTYALDYLLKNYGEEARPALAHILSKVEYYEETAFGHAPLASYSTYPSTAARVDFAMNARVEFPESPPVFRLYQNGDLAVQVRVLGASHHAWTERRVYHDPVAPIHNRLEKKSELRYIVEIETTNALGLSKELKEVEVILGNRSYKVDNEEDTLLFPSSATTVALVGKSEEAGESHSLIPNKLRPRIR